MVYTLRMSDFFRSIWDRQNKYSLDRLIDRRVWDRRFFSETTDPQFDIICDIDKTYLETEFDTVADIARTAFENAADKVTVFGATEVLLAARWGSGSPPNGLHFVSSSPPQLRKVLETKLMKDGLDWTSDTFKNQAYNIRKRRLALLRNHVAYKTLAILTVVAARTAESAAGKSGKSGQFVMIGDNAESDPVVYSGVARLLEGHLTADDFEKYLAKAGASAEEVGQIMPTAIKVVGVGKVAGIFIREVPMGRKHKPFRQLAGEEPTIYPFVSWYDVAIGLTDIGVIPLNPRILYEIGLALHNESGVSLGALLEKLTNAADRFREPTRQRCFKEAVELLARHRPAEWLEQAFS